MTGIMTRNIKIRNLNKIGKSWICNGHTQDNINAKVQRNFFKKFVAQKTVKFSGKNLRDYLNS